MTENLLLLGATLLVVLALVWLVVKPKRKANSTDA
jgi:hypothetical protein